MFDGKYLSVMEMARYLNIGRTKAYNLCKDPSFPIIHIGQKILIDKEKLDTVWLKNKEETTLRGL